MTFNSTILILPGLGNSGLQHWQTVWQRKYGFIKVKQKDWETPVCSDWVVTLNKAVSQYDPAKVILVGHSLACTTIAYWVKQYDIMVKAALLVAPSDTEAGSYPSGTTGFIPVPQIKLPFPSITVVSTNDFYVTLPRAIEFADAWGSELINISDAGHINSTSGLGEWPQGLALLKRLDNL